MDAYTPTFDPTLSGLSVCAVLTGATDLHIRALRHRLRGNEQAARAIGLIADTFEYELEERWIVHVAGQLCRVRSDGSVHAPFLGTAWRSFSGQG